MKTTSKITLHKACFALLLALLPASLQASESGRRLLFRTLGWNTEYGTLYVPGAIQDQGFTVPLRHLSPFYTHRGSSVLEFHTSPPSAKDSKTTPPPPLVSVNIPDNIEQALLLFVKSGSDKNPVIEVKVIDDSLKAFPFMTAKAINFTRKPIEITLLKTSRRVAPEGTSLWTIPSPPPPRTRIMLAAQSGARWQPFATQTLDLMPSHRIYLFLHEATAVTAVTTGEDGSETTLLLKPEERPAHWFAIWDRFDPTMAQNRR